MGEYFIFVVWFVTWCLFGMSVDLETCRSRAGHPSHRGGGGGVKVGVVTSCEVQLWVSILNLLCSL